MSRAETIRTYYKSARDELILRIRLRDQVLFMFLGAAGVIFSIAFGAKSIDYSITLLVPYLGLAASVMAAQHFSVIGSLALYCTEELGEFLKEKEPEEWAPQWDNSKALETSHKEAIALRTIGHLLVLIIPSGLGVAVNWQMSVQGNALNMVAWWSALGCIFLSFVTLFKTHRFRMGKYKVLQWAEEEKPQLTMPSSGRSR